MQNETLLTPASANDTLPPIRVVPPPDHEPARTTGTQAAPARREPKPYPGLRPFRSDESDIFFGRETQTDEMVRRLKTSRFLAVVGTSGCGKSSLVRAGLIAALETGLMGIPEGARWQFAVMRPGDKPMYRLAAKLFDQVGLASEGIGREIGLGLLGARLRRGPLGLIEALQANPLPDKTNLLIVVDQFEEIFRFRREGDINEADAFIALLLASVEQTEFPVFVVLTMRSDFIGDCAVFDGLPEAINESQYLTPRLSRDQRRLAIVGPARASGGEVADDLVTRLLNETGSGPDQLPVLQHLLMRMWTLKVRSAPPGQRILLTMEDYDRVGGLEHALSNHADEIYGGLASDDQRAIAEAMFRRLSESPHDIRRPTAAGEIARIAATQVDAVASVADAFRAPGANFLMPEPGEAIEEKTKLDISHESLIKRWQRLRAWASEEGRIAETYRDLERTAQGYERNEKELFDGLDLQQALLWRRQCKPSPEWAARYGGDFELAMSFLAKSETETNRRKAEKEARRRKTLFWWRIAAVSCFALFVMSAVSARFAYLKQREAAQHQARAIAAQARSALDNGDSRIAVLAALDALPSLGMPDGDLMEMLRSPIDPAMVLSLRDAFTSVAQSPLDGVRYPTLATALWDALRLPVDLRLLTDLLFHPLQDDAIAALERGVYRPFGRIFDSKSDTDPVVAVAVSDVAKIMVTATDKGTIHRWQWTKNNKWEERPAIDHPRLIRPVDTAAGLVRGDVRVLAGVPPGTGPSKVKATPPPARTQQVRQHVMGVALSAGGRWLATMTDWDQATIWNAATGEQVVSWSANQQGRPPKQEIRGGLIAFADDPDRPGYQRILTASRSADALIWDWNEADPGKRPERQRALEDPALLKQPPGQRSHSKSITTLAWSADGRRAVTGSWDGTAKVWDAATGDLLYNLDSENPVRSARFSPLNNNRLVTAHNDGKLRLWCTHRGSAASDTDTANAGGEDGGDANGNDRPPTPCGPVAASDVPPAASDIMIGDATTGRPRPRPDPAVVLKPTPWDTLGKREGEGGGAAMEPLTAVFDPQGERVASAGLDGTVRLWDVASGTTLDVLQGPARVAGRYVYLEFFDNQHLAASFSDSRAFLWTVAPTPLRPRSLPAIAGVGTAAIDDQGRRLAAVRSERTADGTVERIEIWNLSNGSTLSKPVRILHPGREPVTKLAYSPDGRQLLAVAGNTVTVWNANLWRADGGDAPLSTLIHPGAVVDAVFDAAGKRLATTSVDGMARTWDLRRGTLTRALAHGAPVLAVAFDADEDRLATVTDDGIVTVWRAKDGMQIASVPGLPPTGGLPVTMTIRFDPKGDRLNVVRGLDVGKPQAWWVYPNGKVEPSDEDGKEKGGERRLVEPSDDGWMINSRHRMRIQPSGSIEVTTGEDSLHPFAQLPPLRDPLRKLVVSQDGDYLAAFYAKGQVRVMQLPASDGLQFVRYVRKNVLPMLEDPQLNNEERRRYGLNR